ncbi:MAG: hypothetical protein HKN42_17140, partial [Granulosicoccus sp.]|nr:hypothetical protein [Granulosicoccus sp.]
IQRLPFGIHASWFEVPGQAEGRAFCDRRGCECGAVERRHEGSLSRAVADALYMDGGWHRYEMSYQMWLRTPTSSGENHERRTEMIEAACNVMMSQQLLREYAEEVASRLRQQMLAAEERGYDEPEPCEMGIQGACKYFDAVLLYRRLLADSRALTISREEISATALPLDQ